MRISFWGVDYERELASMINLLVSLIIYVKLYVLFEIRQIIELSTVHSKVFILSSTYLVSPPSQGYHLV